ncbi:hypothetical protein A2U01_0068910, partial [Trifolium medium]|nr:hypothetical protein [Trifolium medium]
VDQEWVQKYVSEFVVQKLVTQKMVTQKWEVQKVFLQLLERLQLLGFQVLRGESLVQILR